MRVFIGDTETTGVGPNAGVVEIAWIEVDKDLNVLRSNRSLTNPGMPIPAGASAVHGITDQDVVDAPSLSEFMVEHGEALADEDTVLVCHNAPFDKQHFGPFMPGLLGTICTLKLSRIAYENADNHKLQTLKFWLNLEVDVPHHMAHTALADCQVTAELIRRMAKDTGWTLGDMFHLSNQPRLLKVMPFGKHKGMPIQDLPKQYVRWLRNLPEMDEDLRYTLDNL